MKFNIQKNIPDLHKKKDKNLFIASDKDTRQEYQPSMRSMEPLSKNSAASGTAFGAENQ